MNWNPVNHDGDIAPNKGPVSVLQAAAKSLPVTEPQQRNEVSQSGAFIDVNVLLGFPYHRGQNAEIIDFHPRHHFHNQSSAGFMPARSTLYL